MGRGAERPGLCRTCRDRAVRWRGPSRRLQPNPHGSDDERGPLAGRGFPRIDDRRDAGRDLHGHEPLLVDRRQAPELPVRVRDRLGGEGRRARPNAPQPDLHRHRAAVLGRDGHARWARRVDVLGHAELREGPAPADRPHRASGGSGAVPRDPGWSPRMTTRNSSAETAPAATSAAGAMAAAEQLLHAIRSRASTAEAEATVQQGTSALTRFANGFVHQNVAEELSHVLVRVALDRLVATARLDGPTDRDGLARLADRVLEAARVRPTDAEWPGLTPPAPPPAVDHWDDATALATPDDRAAIVAAFVAASRGLETAGVFHRCGRRRLREHGRPATRGQDDVGITRRHR